MLATSDSPDVSFTRIPSSKGIVEKRDGALRFPNNLGTATHPMGFNLLMKPIVLGGAIFTALCIAAAFAYLTFEPGPVQPVAPAAQKTESTKSAAALTSANDGEMARLKQENALLKQQLDNVRAELSKKEHADAVLAKKQKAGAEGQQDGLTNEALDPNEFWNDVKEATKKDGKEGKQKDRRDRGTWEERAQQFREGMDQFYDDALAQGGPPEVQERLEALRDYSHQMMDLRQQARQATDPAAQEALRQQTDDLRQQMKPLIKDQQDYMLRQAAQASGVTDQRTQNQLVNNVRDTVKSPFFTMNGGRGGRGTGGPPPAPGQ